MLSSQSIDQNDVPQLQTLLDHDTGLEIMNFLCGDTIRVRKKVDRRSRGDGRGGKEEGFKPFCDGLKVISNLLVAGLRLNRSDTHISYSYTVGAKQYVLEKFQCKSKNKLMTRVVTKTTFDTFVPTAKKLIRFVRSSGVFPNHLVILFTAL